MKRAWLVAIFLIAPLVIPGVSFAREDEDYRSEVCSTNTKNCACTSASSSTVTNSTAESAVSTEAACKSFCTDMSAKSYSLTCKNYLNDTLSKGQGNVDGTAAVVEEEKRDPVIPDLIVDIPGIEKFAVSSTGGDVASNFLGTYVAAVYNWLIGAGALVAIVMMMIGGLQYAMARGKAQYIDKGKKRISNALIGLVLLLAAYNIAFLMNPDLVVFDSLSVKHVDKEKYIEESGDSTGAVSITNPPAGVVCEGNSNIYDSAKSMMGKVTYRFGAKGTASDCPEGQLCLDCSGFAGYLASCAGLTGITYSGGTDGIFSDSSEKVATCTTTAINGTVLNPGDVIGWSGKQAKAKGKTFGHIFTYVGNGKIVDSHGGTGKQKGMAVGMYDTTWACKNWMSTNVGLYIVRR